MGYMNFKNPLLETIFKRFKWTRNNTIEIFDAAEKAVILDYTSSSKAQAKYKFQPLLFQFQCIISTTDTYYRKITGNKNRQFGIFVDEGNVIAKEEIKSEDVKKILERQLQEWQVILKDFDDKKTQEYIEEIMAISNHEYYRLM